MTTLTYDRAVEAPPELVWDVISDHELYGELAPNLARVAVVSGETDDLVRRCVDSDGNEWTESCTEWTQGRRFRVSIDVESSDFHRRLFRRFEGEWALVDRPDDVLVTMTFDFDTRYGPLGRLIARYFASRAPALVEPIFDGWAAELESRLEDLDQAVRPRDGTDADRRAGDTSPGGGHPSGPTNGLGP